MDKPSEGDDPVREALKHGEAIPVEFAAWSHGERLSRLRDRFGLNRKQLAALSGVAASTIGRFEKGADLRLGTLDRIYAALGCRLIALPAGGLYDLDRAQAHQDDESRDWRREVRKQFREMSDNAIHFPDRKTDERKRNRVD